ncbi:MAG: dTDP-4-dehydrorhamnose 3,5-epimerase [Pannonibacter sp.]
MSLHFISLEIPEVKIVTPARFGDDRGYFSETFKKDELLGVGIDSDFIQDNESFSLEKGTVRGLHFQSPPYAQAKLVRVLSGAILDVAVDVRTGSPTFGASVKAEISAANGAQIFVPRGFLHGFVTLETNTKVFYKVDAPYSPEHDGGVFWNDPDLRIGWGVAEDRAIVSTKDAAAIRFSDFKSPF